MQRTQKLKQITAVVNRAAEAQVLLENIAANTSDEVATEIAALLGVVNLKLTEYNWRENAQQ